MTTFPESHRDLLDAQVATLATIDSHGLPQLTEVWFLHDEDELRLALHVDRHKTRNLQTRPECSLLVLDLERPYRYLEVRGRARVEPDVGHAFSRKLGAKYDVELAAWDGNEDSRVVVTVEPTKVHAVNMRGD